MIVLFLYQQKNMPLAKNPQHLFISQIMKICYQLPGMQRPVIILEIIQSLDMALNLWEFVPLEEAYLHFHITGNWSLTLK